MNRRIVLLVIVIIVVISGILVYLKTQKDSGVYSGQEYVDGQIKVLFYDNVSRTEIEDLFNSVDSSIVKEGESTSLGGYLVVVTVPSYYSEEEFVDRFKHMYQVKDASKIEIYHEQN